MKYWCLLLVLTISSCAGIKIVDNTSCTINLSQLKKELSKQGVSGFDAVVWYGSKAEMPDYPLCIGSYTLAVKKWKGIKTPVNMVAIPILVSNQNIYVNTYFIEGEFREGVSKSKADESLNNAFQSFESNSKQSISEEKMDSIKFAFFSGIRIQTKAYWRN